MVGFIAVGWRGLVAGWGVGSGGAGVICCMGLVE